MSLIRGAAAILLYAVVGLVAGGVVLLVGFATDPCAPLCIAPSGYQRTEIVEGITTAAGVAYLALVYPMARAWRTGRLWWLIIGGGIGIGAVAIAAILVTAAVTADPATCDCG